MQYTQNKLQYNLNYIEYRKYSISPAYIGIKQSMYNDQKYLSLQIYKYNLPSSSLLFFKKPWEKTFILDIFRIGNTSEKNRLSFEHCSKVASNPAFILDIAR